ncbi:MAG: cytochrome c [Polyangiaceae bacterium]|nr:cytochrome c [Myxococcales bacterium]MCC6903610.1 cytochrome c [Polyangiaceae bacterium]
MQRIVSLVAGALVLGCNQAPSDVRPWRATDHDHTESPNAAQTDVSDGGQTGVMGVDEVALAAWRANCVPCHGVIGRGDGPKGPSTKARDLTDATWQAGVSDEQIATSIRQGKGQMPKFDLPASSVEQLVRLVRLLDARRAEEPTGADLDAGARADARSTGDAGPVADAGPARKPPPPAVDGGAAPAPKRPAP